MHRYRTARRLAALAGAVLALAAVGGCSSGAPLPAVAFPSDTAPTILTVPTGPQPSYTGYAPPLNAVQSQIAGLPAGLTLTYPMTPVTFTVTVKNTSTFAFKQLEPLVVLGQCTCDPTDYNLPPHTILDYWDTTTNAWKSVPAAEMGPKGSYSYSQEIGLINLDPKATLSFRFRMSLAKTTRQLGLTNGTGSLDFFLLQSPSHSRITVGLAPDVAFPLTYKFN